VGVCARRNAVFLHLRQRRLLRGGRQDEQQKQRHVNDISSFHGGHDLLLFTLLPVNVWQRGDDSPLIMILVCLEYVQFQRRMNRGRCTLKQVHLPGDDRV
jgi:hypothetical protein